MTALRPDEDFAHSPTTRESKWSRVLQLIQTVDAATIAGAKTGKITLTCDVMVALLISEALRHYMDAKAPLYRALETVEDRIIRSAAVAEELMRDEYARFALAITDLETVLERFGREPPTMDEIRSARTRRPEHPRRGGVPISDSLRQSILRGRIGDPREPGSEG